MNSSLIKIAIPVFCWSFFCALTYGQTETRIFLEKQGNNPVNTPAGGSVINTTGGTIHTLDIWVEDIDYPNRVNGCQASVPCVVSCSLGGTASFVLGSESDTDPGRAEFCFNGRFCDSGSEIGTQCSANNTTECPDGDGAPCPPGQGPLPVQDPGMCPAGPGLPRLAVAHGTNQPAIVLDDDLPLPPGISSFNSGVCLFGTVKYQLSPNAKGDCVIALPNEPDSAVRDQDNEPIPFTTTSIILRIPVGQCCGGTTCLGDKFTLEECQAAGGYFNGPNYDCSDICECQTNSCCEDNNACTNNLNQAGTCVFPSNVPPGQCCNANNGALTPVNDGNPCTVDTCNPETGTVTHNPVPQNGTTCPDDGNPCTLNRCNNGTCTPTSINTLPCAADQDCVTASGGASQTCGVTTPGLCDCNINPNLSIDCNPGSYPNAACHDEGDKINLTVNVGPGTSIINGAQFRLTYDPTCMEFLGIYPGSQCDTGSPFTTEISRQVVESTGAIFYAVGIELLQGGGTNQGGSLACLSFQKKGNCTDCEVCFDDENPQHTYLSGPAGVPVIPNFVNGGCGCPLRTVSAISMSHPESAVLPAVCNRPTADYTWDDPFSVISDCSGLLDAVCTCTHTQPLVTPAQCNALVEGGGEFPQGIAEICCESTDECGIEHSACWTVEVIDQSRLDLTIQLAPTMTTGQFTRCIELGFYPDCVQPPEIYKEEITFGPPFDFPGHATYSILVPKGQFACITARDQVHTLRSRAMIECTGDGVFIAEFKGDPFFGGNWLEGGNLDGSHVIDVLDMGVFINQYLKPGQINNTCEQVKEDSYVDADINADGIVDALDHAHILRNYLSEDKDSCCPGDGGVASSRPAPRTSITIRELREMGRDDLIKADLNHDGVLDLRDFEALLVLPSDSP